MKKYLYELTQNFTNTHIAVLSLLTSPKNHQLQLIHDILYINQKMKEINDFAYIDINNELSNQKYYYDDVHLNDDGYHILCRILDNYVTFVDGILHDESCNQGKSERSRDFEITLYSNPAANRIST